MFGGRKCRKCIALCLHGSTVESTTTRAPDVSAYHRVSWRKVAWVAPDECAIKQKVMMIAWMQAPRGKLFFFLARAFWRETSMADAAAVARSRLGDERNSCQNVGESVMFVWVFVHASNSQKGKVVWESANL